MIVKQNIPSYIKEYNDFSFDINYEPETIINETSTQTETITEVIDQIQIQPSLQHEYVNIDTNNQKTNTRIHGIYKGVFKLGENSLKTVKRSDKSIQGFNSLNDLPKNNEYDCFYFKPPSSLDKPISFTVDVKFRKVSNTTPKQPDSSSGSSQSSTQSMPLGNSQTSQNENGSVLVDGIYKVDKFFAHIPSIEKTEQLNYDHQCAHSLIENCVDNFSNRKTNFAKAIKAVRNSTDIKVRQFYDKIIFIQQSMLDYDFEYKRLVSLQEIGVNEVSNLSWDQIINLDFSDQNFEIILEIYRKFVKYNYEVILEKDGRENGHSIRSRSIDNGFNQYKNKCRNQLKLTHAIYLTEQEQIFGEYDLFSDYPEDPIRSSYRPSGYSDLSPRDQFDPISHRNLNIVRYQDNIQHYTLIYDWARRNLRSFFHKNYDPESLVPLLEKDRIIDAINEKFERVDVSNLILQIRDGIAMSTNSNLNKFFDSKIQNECPPAQKKVIDAIDRKHRAQLRYIENFPSNKKISFNSNRFQMLKDINNGIEDNLSRVNESSTDNFENNPGTETFNNGFYHYKKQFTSVIKGSWDIWSKGFRDHLSNYHS